MLQPITLSRPDSAQDIQVEPIAVSIPEAALLIGVCPKSMYALAKSEGFPAFRIGKKIAVPVDGLRAWANKRAMAR